MAIYSTFFLCEPECIGAGFPKWKRPLSEPITRKVRNPFTGEELTISTLEPAWDDFESDQLEMPVPQVVQIEGDYQAYLEKRIPSFVRSQPHWCAKNLTPVEIVGLITAATGDQDAMLKPALFAPPSLSAGLDQFPEDFVERIASAEKADVLRIATNWAKILSSPEHTHSASGERVCGDWSVADALPVLNPVAELARQRTARQAMYLLNEA